MILSNCKRWHEKNLQPNIFLQHTCEEGRAYLRISLWHLLELEKQQKQLLSKKLLKWANKKCMNFDIYNVVLKKKKTHPEISLFYSCVPKILIWSTVFDTSSVTNWNWQFFALLPFLPKNPKNKNFEKMKKKNCWRHHHFTHVYQKPQSCKVQFMKYEVRDIIFLSFWPNFCPFMTPSPPP